MANFTPVSYQEYEIGVPAAGKYKVILNTDDDAFFGSGIKVTANKNATVSSVKASVHGFSHSIKIAMGGLTTIYLQKVEDE